MTSGAATKLSAPVPASIVNAAASTPAEIPNVTVSPSASKAVAVYPVSVEPEPLVAVAADVKTGGVFSAGGGSLIVTTTRPSSALVPFSTLVIRTVNVSPPSSSPSPLTGTRISALIWPASMTTQPETVVKSLSGVAVSPTSARASKQTVTGWSYIRLSCTLTRA